MAATTRAKPEISGAAAAGPAARPTAADDGSGIEALYPPGRRPSHRRGYLDDTLDAYPPRHLYAGKPTPEQVAAAKQLIQERGLLPRNAAKVADTTKRRRPSRPKRPAQAKKPAAT